MNEDKIFLLTDIIRCSTCGEYSQVEVAYDLLLCNNKKYNTIVGEEFANQCIVFHNHNY